MARVFADRVHETTTTTGTGPLTLAGAVNGSWRTFDSVLDINDTCFACIADPDNGDFEVGEYTYSDTNELTRTSVDASSNAGAAVDFQAGTKFVFMTPVASMFPISGLAAAGAVASSGLTMATDRILGRDTTSTGAIEELTVSGGLGITGGALSITDAELSALAGLTSAADKGIKFTGSGTAATYDLSAFALTFLDDADALTVRGTLGLVIGTNVQAYDAELAALAGLVSAADKLPYFTGSGTASLADFTAGGRALVNSAGTSGTFPYFSSSNTVTLGAVSAGGLALVNVTGTADRVPWFSAANTAGLITVTASGRALMGVAGTSGSAPYLSGTDTWSLTATSAGGRALWNATGTADRVPWFSAANTVGLITVTASGRALMGIAGTSGSLPYLSGTDTWSLSTITTAGRNLLDDADAAAQRTTLGIAGKQAIFIPASAMVSRTTNGAASGTAEMSSNKNMFATLDFDTTTQEFAQFMWCMPSSWDEGTVTFIPVWSHPSTTTNFGVVFQLAGVAISNDDAGDVAFGTAQTSTDIGGTTNDIYKGPESSAITIAGSPAAGDYVMFQIARVPANGSDTLAVDARLHGIVLFITTNDTVDS